MTLIVLIYNGWDIFQSKKWRSHYFKVLYSNELNECYFCHSIWMERFDTVIKSMYLDRETNREIRYSDTERETNRKKI